MRRLSWLILASMLLVFQLSAQQITGTIVGTVSDPSGSVVPGAEVTITNLDTNAARKTATDDTGNFTLPYLMSGNYKVVCSAKGFRPQMVDGVRLQVGQTMRVDLNLEVGDSSQTVDVQASAAVLQTENAAVGTVIDSQKIVDLPLNGRNFVQLAQLIPGAQPGTPDR
jgi:hypothetical protein